MAMEKKNKTNISSLVLAILSCVLLITPTVFTGLALSIIALIFANDCLLTYSDDSNLKIARVLSIISIVLSSLKLLFCLFFFDVVFSFILFMI